MSDAGHPKNFGYKRCLRCGCWRPEREVKYGLLADHESTIECVDEALCLRLAEGPTNAAGREQAPAATP